MNWTGFSEVFLVGGTSPSMLLQQAAHYLEKKYWRVGLVCHP